MSEVINNDANFINDLRVVRELIDAVIQVSDTQGSVHPNYVLEKITTAKDSLDWSIRYWESRLESSKEVSK